MDRIDLKGIAAWLLPTLISPVLGGAAVIWWIAQGSRLPNLVWWGAAGIACVLGFFYAVFMAGLDVILLKARLRQLPTGMRALLMGLAAPLPLFWSWKLLVKFAIGGLGNLVLTAFGPMLAIGLVLRFVLGSRPEHWRKR